MSQVSILSAIPNGGSAISFADFAKKVGGLANAIAFTQPKSLSRKNGHVTITCAGPGKDTSPAGSLDHDATVTSDVSETATSITLANIKGLRAENAQGEGGNVTKAVITPLANGHFKIDATVTVLFVPITISKELDQNGQIVN